MLTGIPVWAEVVHVDDETDEGAGGGNASREKALEDKILGKRPIVEVAGATPHPLAQVPFGSQLSGIFPDNLRFLNLPRRINLMNCGAQDTAHFSPLLGAGEMEHFKGMNFAELVEAMAISSIKVPFLLPEYILTGAPFTEADFNRSFCSNW